MHFWYLIVCSLFNICTSTAGFPLLLKMSIDILILFCVFVYLLLFQLFGGTTIGFCSRSGLRRGHRQLKETICKTDHYRIYFVWLFSCFICVLIPVFACLCRQVCGGCFLVFVHQYKTLPQNKLRACEIERKTHTFSTLQWREGTSSVRKIYRHGLEAQSKAMYIYIVGRGQLKGNIYLLHPELPVRERWSKWRTSRGAVCQ